MSAVARRPRLVLLACALPLAACHSWRVQPGTPEALLAAPPASMVRLRLQDTTHVVLRQPHLAGDSVIGSEKDTTRAVPLAAVTEVSVRRFSAGRTAGLVAASAAGFVLFVVIGCEATDCNGVDFGPSAAVR